MFTTRWTRGQLFMGSMTRQTHYYKHTEYIKLLRECIVSAPFLCSVSVVIIFWIKSQAI
jgi:hypothetical protein